MAALIAWRLGYLMLGTGPTTFRPLRQLFPVVFEQLSNWPSREQTIIYAYRKCEYKNKNKNESTNPYNSLPRLFNFSNVRQSIIASDIVFITSQTIFTELPNLNEANSLQMKRLPATEYWGLHTVCGHMYKVELQSVIILEAVITTL